MASDLTTQVLTGYGVSLQPVDEEHLEQLRLWRNDPVIRQFMLSQAEITPQQQQAWFQAIQNNDTQKHFVICYKQRPIGAANIKEQQHLPIVKAEHPENLRVEPGIYLGDERFRNNVLAFAPSLLLLDYCFEQLCLPALYATVHKENEAALSYNQKLGYRKVASNEDWISIELTPQRYIEATVTLKSFLSRRIKQP